MSDFNPDDYLKETESAFDPDSYLSEPEAKAPKDGAGQAFLEHYGNTATMGYLPHLQALTEKLMPNPNADLDEQLQAQGFNVQQDEPTYIKSRDENINRLVQQKEDFPKASLAGDVTGMAAAALMTSRVLPVPDAATWLGRAHQAGKTGALMGAIMNPGDTEGEFNPIQPLERGKNAGKGYVLGAVTQAGIEGLAKGGEVAAEKLKELANSKAYRALGRQTPKAMEKAIATGQDQALGRELLDEGAIPILGTPGRIAKRVGALKEEAGEEVGRLIDGVEGLSAEFQPIKIRDVDHGAVDYTPIKFKTHKNGKVVQEEVQFSPIRFDENPVKRTMPWLRDADAPPVLVKGDAQVLQHEMRLPAGATEVIPGQVKQTPVRLSSKEVIPGKVQSVPVRGSTIDSKALAEDLLNAPEVKALRSTPGMEGVADRVEKLAETLASNGTLSVKEAQALRQQIDQSINFAKKVPEMKGIQPYLYKIRTGIRDKMNDVVNALGGEGKDALLNANRRYSHMAHAEDILEREIARNANNRSVSLTDTIAGAGGMATGNPGLGLALGAVNKAGRAFGNSMQARGYDAVANMLAKSPRFAEMATNNPVAFQALVNRMGDRLQGGPEFKREEQSPILKDQRLMQMLRDKPDLVDHIQNDKLRAQIKKAIENRGPASEPRVSEEEAREQFLRGN